MSAGGRWIGLWLWGLTLLLVGGCAPAILTVDDTVSLDGRAVPLVAYVEREHLLGLRSDLEHIRVSFRAGETDLDTDRTGEYGRAAIDAELSDSPMSFQATAMVDGRVLERSGRIYHWRRGRVILVVDVDHTISETNYRKLVLKEEIKVSPPIKDSRDALRELADDYYILYLTARPRFLLDKTRGWLKEYSFPEGPVVAAPGLRDAIRAESYKRQTLKHLRQRWPDILIGIGNRPHDLEAYADNEMLPILVRTGQDPDEEATYYPGAVTLYDWRSVRKFFAANRSGLSDSESIKRIIEGKQMLQVPLTSWHDADEPDDDDDR